MLIFMSMHSFYVLKVGADVAYMDTLRYLTYYPQIKDNVWNMFSYWNQGDHKGVFSLFVLFVNIKYFEMNILLANLLTGISLSLIAYVISYQWLKSIASIEHSPRMTYVYFSSIVFFVWLTVFGFHAFELYTLDLGFPEITRNLLYVLIASVVFQKSKPLSKPALFITGVAIFFTMIAVSYGRVYAFSLSLIFTAIYQFYDSSDDGTQLVRFKFILFSSIAGLITYGVLSIIIPASIDASGLTLDFSFRALHGFLYSLSSSLIGAEAAERFDFSSVALSVFGCYIISIIAYSSWVFVHEVRNKSTYFPVFLVLYGLANALSVAISRGATEYSAYMASRYYPDLCLLILGLVWMITLILKSSTVGAKEKFRFKWLLSIFMIMWVLCYLLTTIVEIKTVPYRVNAFDKLRSISLSCDDLTEKESELLQANNSEIANNAISVQRKYGLGGWAEHRCE